MVLVVMVDEIEVAEVEQCAAPGIADSEPQEVSQLEETNSDRQADLRQLAVMAEALLFASGEPVALSRLAEVANVEAQEMEAALEILSELLSGDRAIELVKVADKYQLRTKAEYGRWIQALAQVRPRRLSPAALETLSVIAYRQPVVRSDIEKIRGVDATPTIKTLLDRRLIKIVGHQATVGQPALYGTTEEFLKLFGLSSLSELPSLRDLSELEADPGEVEERSSEDESVDLKQAAGL